MSQLDHQGWKAYYDDLGNQLDPLERRLAQEHLLVAALCEEHEGINYKLTSPNDLPPRDFRITFKGLRSIVGIDHEMLPVFGDTHILEIHLGASFPVDPPVCYMATDIWHPNIQADEGPYQGRICGNTEGFGAFYSVDQLILRVAEMLRYENYHAALTYPYPEDENVARWIREYAEPLGIVKQGIGLTADGAMPDGWQKFVKPEEKLKIKLSAPDYE